MSSAAPKRTPSKWKSVAVLAAALLLVCGWRYRVTKPDHRLARGEAAIQSGDWDDAEAFSSRLEAAGHTDHASYLRGKSLFAQHLPARALAEFNRVRGDGPMRLSAAAISGHCLIELKNLPEASRVLDYVLSEEPDNVEAHRGLAVIAYDLGQLGAAVHHLVEVARLDPADARPHRLIGLIYKDMAQNEEAVAAYRESLARGLKARPRDEVRVELAEVLIRLARYSEGLETLSSGDADSTPATAAIEAECLRGLGRRQEAAQAIDRILASSPNAELYRIRGQLDLDDGRHADAVRALERASWLAPWDYLIHFLLAQAYADAGRKQESEAASSRAEALRKDMDVLSKLSQEAMERPWDPAVRLQLAEVSDRLGKPQLAAMWRAAAAACRGQNR